MFKLTDYFLDAASLINPASSTPLQFFAELLLQALLSSDRQLGP